MSASKAADVGLTPAVAVDVLPRSSRTSDFNIGTPLASLSCVWSRTSDFNIGTPLASLLGDRLVGLVVRRPPRERKVPGSNPACDGIFSGSSHTSYLKIGTPVATLPGAWRYRVSTGTVRPGVSIL